MKAKNMEVTLLTTQQYADLRGITQRAVQKAIKYYSDGYVFPPKAFPGVAEIKYFGKIAQLVMEPDYKETIARFNKEKERAERERK